MCCVVPLRWPSVGLWLQHDAKSSTLAANLSWPTSSTMAADLSQQIGSGEKVEEDLFSFQFGAESCELC